MISMSKQLVERVCDGDMLLAVVIRKKYVSGECEFLTPSDFPFQFGVHNRKKGAVVQAHEHVPFAELKNLPAQEFFYVEKGKILVTLYAHQKMHSTLTLEKGDAVVLNCGHKIEFLEDAKMIELKQGPYRGKEKEKVYF